FGEVFSGAIRRVHLSTGEVTTIFQLESPMLADLEVFKSNLYVVDEGNAIVLRINLDDSVATRIAGEDPLAMTFPPAFNGDGIATELKLHDPSSLAIDPEGETLYTGEQRGQRIRQLELKEEKQSAAMSFAWSLQEERYEKSN